MSPPGDPASLIDSLIDRISDCVPAIGTDDFTERFHSVVTATGAGQATAIAYEHTEIRYLLSKNFLPSDRSGIYTSAYIDGWFREDPLFTQVMALGEGESEIRQLEELMPYFSARYASKFFADAGWQTKVSIMVSQASLRLVLNLYFEADNADQSSPRTDSRLAGLYRLMGRMVATHFTQRGTLRVPPSLAALSGREQQVCLGVLAGKKAEIIAGEIGIGASSVVTYRQRAYQKLGISSRGQLFSICRA